MLIQLSHRFCKDFDIEAETFIIDFKLDEMLSSGNANLPQEIGIYDNDLHLR